MAKYSIGDYVFKPEEFLPDSLFYAITDVRVNEPNLVVEEAKKRKRRKSFTKDGKLIVLATDHPGRRVTGIRDEPLAMGSHHSYLARILRVITHPDFDGVMGNTNQLEDLLIVNYLLKKNGAPSFLDEKVMIGCMNRGGVAGNKAELDDTMTCFSAESLHLYNFDGGKQLLRIDPNYEESLRTVKYCADAISALNKYNLNVFLEPMTVEHLGNGKANILHDIPNLVKDAGLGNALGDSARRTWLKLSYCDGYEAVSKATALPILMLGGPAREDPTKTIEDFWKGMQAGPNVRGAMVGRNVSFPFNDDPLAVAVAVNAVIRGGCTPDEAIDRLHETRHKEMDRLSKYWK